MTLRSRLGLPPRTPGGTGPDSDSDRSARGAAKIVSVPLVAISEGQTGRSTWSNGTGGTAAFGCVVLAGTALVAVDGVPEAVVAPGEHFARVVSPGRSMSLAITAA